MKKTRLISILLFVFILSSCNDYSRENERNRVLDLIDSKLKKLEMDAEQSDDAIDTDSVNSTISEVERLEKNTFNEYYLNQKVQLKAIPCNSSFSFSKSTNLDSLLSYMDCIIKREHRIKLLRRTLLISHYDIARKVDSLKYLSNRDLIKMLSYVVDQDILSEAMESNSPRLSELYSKISSLVEQQVSKALVLDYIKDSVFNYFYLSYSFNRPTKNILMLDYNAAGMAGSAEKRYFLKVGKVYKQINLDPIIKKVNKVMTKVAKEDASADTDRFEGMFTWNKKKSSYEMQLFIHVRSGAMCCPPYIVRFYTKDFRTIQIGSLQYSTTAHISESNLQPKWINIE